MEVKSIPRVFLHHSVSIFHTNKTASIMWYKSLRQRALEWDLIGALERHEPVRTLMPEEAVLAGDPLVE